MVRTLQTLAWGLIASLASAAVSVPEAAAQVPSPSAVGWLRYAIPPDPPRYHDMPHAVVLLGDGNGHAAPEEETAADELDRGLGHMVAGTDVLLRRIDPRNDAIILGTPESLRRGRLGRIVRGWIDKPLPEEGFRIVHLRNGIRQWWILEGGSPRGELYAAFRFAAMVAEDRQLPDEVSEAPRVPLRAIQIAGTIQDSSVLRQYGRLLSSVGLNGLILGGDTTEAQRVLRPFGIRVWRDAADLERDRSLHVQPGTLPNAPLSGLPADVPQGGPIAATLDIVPGGLRQQVTPIRAWSETVQELGPHVRMGGVVGTLSADTVLPLLDQPLLQANLFAFGRTVWNPSAAPAATLDDWARESFGDDARIFGVAKSIVLDGEQSYAQVTSPMGLPRLGSERGPDPADAARFAGHPIADSQTIGVDRTARDLPAAAADPATCPAHWLLLLHRLPYTAKRGDGRTVAESLYDDAFTGATTSMNAVDAWDETKPLLDPERWQPIHAFLEESAQRSEIWRDAVTAWLFRVSGIPDALGYAGKHPGRVEAEAMTLSGYRPVLTEESESASGGAYVACSTTTDCSVSTTFQGERNVYRIETGYFDADTTPQRFTLRVNGTVRATWTSVARHAPPGGDSAARSVLNGVRLNAGDTVEVRSTGPLDFLEISRDPRWN